MATEGTCCICLESLFTENTILGVTSPCGHPIHQHCFRGWEKSAITRDDDYGVRPVSCPTCNSKNVTFTRIFISFPTDEALSDDEDDNDDDSCSASSAESMAESGETPTTQGSGECESMKNSNDESSRDSKPAAGETEREETAIESEAEKSCPESNDNNDDDDLVDLTNSPEKPTKSCTGKKAATTLTADEQLKQTRRKMKLYKKRFRQCKSKFEEFNQKHRELCQSHQELRDAVKETQEDRENNLLELAANRLTIARLNRQVEETSRQLADAIDRRRRVEKDYNELKTDFSKIQKSLEEDIQKAKHEHSVEMKRIREDYPKVMKENQQLKTTLEEKTKHWDNLKEKMKTLEPEVKKILGDGVKEKARPDPRQAKKNIQMMHEMEDEQQLTVAAQNKRKRELLENQPKPVKKNVASSRALKMVKSSTTAGARHPAAKRTSLDDLLEDPQSRKQQSKQGLPSSSTTFHLKPASTIGQIKRRATCDSRDAASSDISKQNDAKRRVSLDSNAGNAVCKNQNSHFNDSFATAPTFTLSKGAKRKPAPDRRKGGFVKKGSVSGNADIRVAFAKQTTSR